MKDVKSSLIFGFVLSVLHFLGVYVNSKIFGIGPLSVIIIFITFILLILSRLDDHDRGYFSKFGICLKISSFSLLFYLLYTLLISSVLVIVSTNSLSNILGELPLMISSFILFGGLLVIYSIIVSIIFQVRNG